MGVLFSRDWVGGGFRVSNRRAFGRAFGCMRFGAAKNIAAHKLARVGCAWRKVDERLVPRYVHLFGSHLQKQVGLRPMLLGADFLLAHRVLVAHSQRKIYFTYAGGPIFQLSRPLETRSDPSEEVGTKPKTGEN